MLACCLRQFITPLQNLPYTADLTATEQFHIFLTSALVGYDTSLHYSKQTLVCGYYKAKLIFYISHHKWPIRS
jgi:hypothetical protein